MDTEGGAATLIVTPAGESVLVDTGFSGGRDAGRIHQVATQAGLRSIDHVILTHYHMDHFGGLAELAELMPVGTLHERGRDTAPEPERSEPRLDVFAKAKVGRRRLVKAGDDLDLKAVPGGLTPKLRFLAANQEVVKGGRSNQKVCAGSEVGGTDTSDNANSLAMVLEFGAFRFFDGGDLTWNIEAKLVCPLDTTGSVDVFQIDHHGTDNSNNPVLVATLAPTVVVFNNGPRKGGDKNSVQVAKNAPSVKAVYQLHRNVKEGAPNTADELIANRDEDCAGNHIKLSVDAKGDAYTVAIPAARQERAFKTRAPAKVGSSGD
ncbi:MAG TPA: MBL fold metallo-hydrolase [Gemmatimonadales bacterium]|nr:MBL fold metallo-hydrolase [Gemmatimonadales bacterium]